ncbi:MAG: hypothetical protein ACI9S8_002713 [Chlamydiales bacterium]|jgi:hypothetical protein
MANPVVSILNKLTCCFRHKAEETNEAVIGSFWGRSFKRIEAYELKNTHTPVFYKARSPAQKIRSQF